VSLRKILVIGVGSFGGFLCKHLSELDSVKELYIIDLDLVETKNVRNSIYSISQVGEYKVDALSDNIQNEVSVMGFRSHYEEGKTKIPKVDLVIDCRDMVCDRGTEIDVRLYVSGRQLIIDCRKNVKCHREYHGAYSINLSKSEISKAAFFAAQAIESKQLSNLRENKLIQNIDLDLLPEALNRSIKETLDNKSDILYEVFDQTNRIQRLEENIEPIMKLNKKNDVKVLVSERSECSIIPMGSLNNSSDLIEKLTEMVKERSDFMNFLIVMKERNGEAYVELIEETGGS
jgi:hypothetical protein